jgi:phosphoribosyl 1,2-cyclic phosphate phosphodiesterase
MTMKFTILGCGSSMGVPRPALGWGACDPNNPKNRRRRTSLLVERAGPNGATRVLVDTSPDLREQLLDAEVQWLDGVLMTHEHADHCHGIGYCFATPPGSEYPPIANEHRVAPGTAVTIEGEGGPITALPILQKHGDVASLGFRFGDFAYSCDLSDLPPESAKALAGLEVWVVDALRYQPHPSHFSLADALAWIERIKPKRAILTNLHSDLDYDALRSQLPPNVEPAYDGIGVTLSS